MADIIQGFRNEERWLPIIRAGIGTVVKGLIVRCQGRVDADSFPEIIKRRVKK